MELIVTTEERIREIVLTATEQATTNALYSLKDHLNVDPLKPLSIVGISEKYGICKKTLFARINEREIETFKFKDNKKQLAIFARDLYSLLKD